LSRRIEKALELIKELESELVAHKRYLEELLRIESQRHTVASRSKVALLKELLGKRYYPRRRKD